MNDITRLLSAAREGDAQASEELLPLVYGELRKLASARLRTENPGQTLQATALVHEAYLRLVEPSGSPNALSQQWDHRGHFFAAAAEAMRRILIDIARHKRSLKRGGAFKRVPLETAAAVELSADSNNDQLLAIDRALTEFEKFDPAKAKLVKLRFFAGLTIEEAADALGISRATAIRHWTYARAWIYGCIQEAE